MKHQHDQERIARLRTAVAEIEALPVISQRAREAREGALRLIFKLEHRVRRGPLGRAQKAPAPRAWNAYETRAERNAARRVRTLRAALRGPRPPTPAEARKTREANKLARDETHEIKMRLAAIERVSRKVVASC